MINFVFRLDSSSEIGYGHLMRCMTLANKLIYIGFKVDFIMSYDSQNSLRFINNENFNIIFLPQFITETEDAHKCLGIIENYDSVFLVVDNYSLSIKWECEVFENVKKLIVIDDLANRNHECNVLIDSSYDRKDYEYKKLVPDSCQLILGERHCLLRPEFENLRDSAYKRRVDTEFINRLLISFGATDSEKYTLEVLNFLGDIGFSGEIDILISTGCTWLDELNEIAEVMTNVTLHINANNVAELMLSADLAIGALGTSTWERACLGLPCLCVITADNQIYNADKLNSIKAIFLSDMNQIFHDLRKILLEASSLCEWHRVSDESFKLVDGKGVSRVTHEILKSEFNLVEFRLSDTDDLYAWQSQPGARQHSRDETIPLYSEHVDWVVASLSNPVRRMWIIKINDISAGYIRLDVISEEEEEVSILISDKFRGLGVAKFAVSSSVSERIGRHVVAHVKPDNHASINLFKSCGFKRIDHEHFLWSR